MRILGSIPCKEFKISIFSWNERYIAKFEAGAYEQLYKFPAGIFSNWEEMESLFDEEFLQHVKQRFLEMRTDSEKAYQRFSTIKENKNAPL